MELFGTVEKYLAKYEHCRNFSPLPEGMQKRKRSAFIQEMPKPGVLWELEFMPDGRLLCMHRDFAPYILAHQADGSWVSVPLVDVGEGSPPTCELLK